MSAAAGGRGAGHIGRRRLTPPSSGRPKACFEGFAPPLMSNVRPQMRLLLALLAAFCLCANATAGPYSEEPFTRPVFDRARMLVEAVQLNNWLNANFATLSQGQRQAVREHVHALIDSRLKEQYATSKSLIPAPDPVLALMYSWAARLGVYGAADVFAVVRGPSPLQPVGGPSPPLGIAVTLKGERLELSSVGNWSVAVPVNFFIFDLRNAEEPSGMASQAAGISTGTAPDAAAPGYSQATIALFYAEDPDLQAFTARWTERLGIPEPVQPEEVQGSAYRSRRAFDQASRLHKEVVFLPSSKGSLAVVYAGLDGTFQWNRPHFVDLLNNLRVIP